MDIKVKTPNKYTNSDIFFHETGHNLLIIDNEFYVRGDTTDSAAAQLLLDNHNPLAPVELSVSEKLASVGLSVDDLKAALGL